MTSASAHPPRVRADRGLVVLALVPAVVAAIVFANTLANDLLYDDPLALEVAAQPLTTLLTHRYGLAYVTIKAEGLLWSSPAGFHATNVLIHALCAALAGLVAYRFLESRRAALLCAILFAVHPVHVEAVASIENRKDLLGMVCTAIVVLLWMRPRERTTYGVALLTFIVGLWAKDVAIVGIVGVLLWLDVFHARRRDESATRRLTTAATALVPFLVAAVIVALVTAGNPVELFAPGTLAKEYGNARYASYPKVLESSAAAVLDVGRLLVFPVRLSADWPTPTAHAGLGAFVALAWLATTVALARRAPVVSLSMAWLFFTYLPVSNIVPLTPHFVAERYLYVPSLGFCLLVAIVFDAALARAAAVNRTLKSVTLLVIVICLGAAGLRTVMRNRDWHDSIALWSSALRAVPDGTARIHGELGLALLNARRASEATGHLTRAADLEPDIPEFANNAGLALSAADQPASAAVYLERALNQWPDDPAVHYNLGKVLAQLGRREEAAVHLRRAMDEQAWANARPWARAALAQQRVSVEAFRQKIARWLEANAPSGGTPR